MLVFRFRCWGGAYSRGWPVRRGRKSGLGCPIALARLGVLRGNWDRLLACCLGRFGAFLLSVFGFCYGNMHCSPSG